jgi:hypothetical protein
MLRSRLTSNSRSPILPGLVGSTVHRLSVDDGIGDCDERGVCVEARSRDGAPGSVRAINLPVGCRSSVGSLDHMDALGRVAPISI